MHVLFIHRGFPGQFRYVAPQLVERHGWHSTFLTADDRVASPPCLRKFVYQPVRDGSGHGLAAAALDESEAHALGVYDALREHRAAIRPDLIVSHGSYGSTVFLPYLYDAPIINLFEYFYRPVGQDLGYRPEQAVTEGHLLRCRLSNGMSLLDLESCDCAWCPTEHQRSLMPCEYHDKIEVVHDGIDTEAFRRDPAAPRRLPDGTEVARGTRVVTYAARGFEKLRGFDVFMRVAKRVYEQLPDVLFVVAGSDSIFYGSERQRGDYCSFRERVLAEGDYDLSRFRFVGKLPQAALARLLSISDLHVYLTVPFFTSWSPLEAMSSGCVLLASDTACVREYVRPGHNGLVCDFFDEEGMARQAVEVLRDPAAHRPLGEAARRTIEETYSVEVTLPRIKAMFERVASKPREPSVRAELLVRAGECVVARPPSISAALTGPEHGAFPRYDGAIPFGADRLSTVTREPFAPPPPTLDVRLGVDVPVDAVGISGTGWAPALGGYGIRPARLERTVLFAWELGGGLGHMLQMLPLAQDLAKAGHRVFVCLRHLERAAAVFGSAGVRVLQAPFLAADAARFSQPLNYAQMLANVGFGSDGELFGRAAAWRNLIRLVEPDLMVIDHAPTALLAARGAGCRRVLIGSGFCCPPDEPDMTRWGVLRAQALAETSGLSEQAEDVLRRVNRVLGGWGAPPLERLGQLYGEVEENFLTTVPELDHFPQRRGAAYWGPVLADPHAVPGDVNGRTAPAWPEGSGPRVFAYLKTAPSTGHVLEALKQRACPTLAYVEGASAKLRRSLESNTVRVSDAPLDLRGVGRACDVAVLNGGHGATVEMLLAGRPLVQVPLALEQELTAQAVKRLGAGEPSDGASAESVRAALDRVLVDGSYAAASRRFAERYAAFDPARQRRAMRERAEELLAADLPARPATRCDPQFAALS